MTREAVRGLADGRPELSAEHTLTRTQGRGLVATGIGLVVVLTIFPVLTLQCLMGLATAMYFASLGYRLAAIRRGMRENTMVSVSDEVALAAAPARLPRYTVLVPAYHEAEVIKDLLASIASLDYPPNKLQVLVLVEPEDKATLAAVRAAEPPRYVRVMVVPQSQPRTKPKACNVGLAFATGELITIFDAEDRPEPLQLRRAAVALENLPAHVVCLQSRLGYYNGKQNLITRWFTGEYATWFGHLLPGVVSLGAPLPLGGTSNHMRVDVLRELGGWDPFNVTEDADLGIRLHRSGYRTMVLDSLTLEEANSDFVNWAKQRSRWYKGYLQTWLVHMRHPGTVRRQIGWRGLLGLNLFVAGTPLLALINPIFWFMVLLFFVGRVHGVATLFPAPVYYPAMICWLFGNTAVVYFGVLSLRAIGRQDLVPAAIVIPLYWVMMSIAAAKAALQLALTPSFWEKTTHGLLHTARRPESGT